METATREMKLATPSERWLEAHGYRVLRFWNNDVMRNMEGVLRALEEALDGG
jgi:very-short-patch-repair endonuclease